MKLTLTLPTLRKVALDYLFTFVIFVVFSTLLTGGPELAHNFFWALVVTFLFQIRDSLEPKPRRIFNLVIYGSVVIVVIAALTLMQNTPGNAIASAFAGVYCAYRFYETFNEKP